MGGNFSFELFLLKSGFESGAHENDLCFSTFLVAWGEKFDTGISSWLGGSLFTLLVGSLFFLLF